MSKIGHVLSSAPSKITVEIGGLENLEKNKTSLQIGKYLKIEDGNHNLAVASINNITGTQVERDGEYHWRFLIEATPAGALINDDGKTFFHRGCPVLPVPTEPVYVFEKKDLETIFAPNADLNFNIGSLADNQSVPFFLDGDKFFGKHIGIVGSTGSGKSCTVASLLQSVVGISNKENLHHASQRNSHILIFDMHAEYSSAFTIDADQKFQLNLLDVDKLSIPYWLMNSEELESLFIESGEQSSHNQISQFKRAVILNKERHNPELEKITYDTPAYFSITEVFHFITNKNNLTTFERDGRVYLASLTEPLVEFSESALWQPIIFENSTGNSSHKTLGAKVSKDGGFNGEFDRFISRLETRLNDKRLSFLLSSRSETGDLLSTSDFGSVLKQFLGYLNRSNVTIVDLSGIPFEVLSITISLISRLIFDFAFHYSKVQHGKDLTNNIPFMIVCEEAHNYIPQHGGAEYNASKRSIERIAKEGRKYGLSLMVVSQRPSEVSDTIFSQCNNFLALRLTNKADQNYIKALLPDSSSEILELLPTLGQGEAYIVGDAVLMPSLVKLPRPNPEPKSASIKAFTEWRREWQTVDFDDVIKRWRKDSAK